MDLHAPLVVHGYEHAPLLEVEGIDPHSPQQKVLIHQPIQSQELMSTDHRNGEYDFSDEQYHAHSSNQSGDGEFGNNSKYIIDRLHNKNAYNNNRQLNIQRNNSCSILQSQTGPRPYRI
ncbi:unnamed protein product [Pieris macdunnoughi]|uniref:Uncharacterized protein n=1 Tax=Pieris macdunnoughi TaxID=345717 RepID=A0A821WH98_9NEOP|nr:unnamed protein product [Pieris macdunnoughi]